MPIYFDGTTVDVIETHEKFYHGCFSGSGWSYNCNLLSRLHFSTEIIDDCMIRIVSEMYMVELYPAFQMIV